MAELDYVRGLAVLGILLVNMPLYGAPGIVYFNNEATGWFPGWYDQAALRLVRVVAEGKFYTLFSLLFGLGFGVQVARATARGVDDIGRVYARRLGVLLAVGLVHLLLFWWGDVLHVYAVLGFVLLLFRRRRQKTVLVWAACLAVMPWLAGGTFFAVRALREPPARAVERNLQAEARRAAQLDELPAQVRAFAEGTWSEAHRVRSHQVLGHLPGEVGWGMSILPLFLLGLWVARSGFVEDVPGRLGTVRALAWVGLAGAVTSVALVPWRMGLGTRAMDGRGFAYLVVAQGIARPLHALFYAAVVVLLVQREPWRRRLAPLAAVGQMALTSYLTHTLVCLTIFNGVGFGLGGLGLYGRVGFAGGLGLTLAVWAAQLALSPWWLARFRFGPAEWAWRCLTYGARQPFRRDVPAAAGGRDIA